MHELSFNDQAHREEFNRLVAQYGRITDKEYTAAFYILASDEELRRKGARFITDSGIEWSRIDRQAWSHGYKLLVDLAKHLFRSSGKIELVQGLMTWDAERYNLAIEAIQIRKWGLR